MKQHSWLRHQIIWRIQLLVVDILVSAVDLNMRVYTPTSILGIMCRSAIWRSAHVTSRIILMYHFIHCLKFVSASLMTVIFVEVVALTSIASILREPWRSYHFLWDRSLDQPIGKLLRLPELVPWAAAPNSWPAAVAGSASAMLLWAGPSLPLLLVVTRIVVEPQNVIVPPFAFFGIHMLLKAVTLMIIMIHSLSR